MDWYTAGIWLIKDGHENIFVREWTSFANRMVNNTKGTGKAFLLQDITNPLRYFSFGAWENEKAIQNWVVYQFEFLPRRHKGTK
jgi:heme-degrading monooxygenase HmoA